MDVRASKTSMSRGLLRYLVVRLAAAAIFVAHGTSCASTGTRVEPPPHDESPYIAVSVDNLQKFADADRFSRTRVADMHRIPHTMIRSETSVRLIVGAGRPTMWYGPDFDVVPLGDKLRIEARGSTQTFDVDEVRYAELDGPLYNTDSVALIGCLGFTGFVSSCLLSIGWLTPLSWL